MKRVAIILVPVLLLLALYLTSTQVFQARTYINASPEEVWAVLIDHEGYKHWNPLLLPTSGNFQEGSSIVYRMTPPENEPSEFSSKVLELKPYELIRQHAGMPFLLTADHEWRLESVDGGTQVQQYEIDKGIWMWFWDSSWVESSYQQVNEALNSRVLELKRKL